MNSCVWFFKNLSWYLVLLTGCLGVSVVIASVHVKRIADVTESVLHTLGVKESSISDVMTGVDWSLTISWGLVGSVLAGATSGAAFANCRSRPLARPQQSHPEAQVSIAT